MKRHLRRQDRDHRALRFELLEDRRLLAVAPEGFTETAVATGLISPITLENKESGRI